MSILVINTGSSSVKLAAFNNTIQPQKIADTRYENARNQPESLLHSFLEQNDIGTVDAVVHRVVHGGLKFIDSIVINDEVLAELERLSVMAPLHNPVALSWIFACIDILNDGVPQIAMFDTAFFSKMPALASVYAIPQDLSERYGIKRYGFQGIAHEAMSRRWSDIAGAKNEKVIAVHLGAGCSVTALRDGAPQDTSMGFSPLEGLVMATRPGDIDLGIITYLMREHEFSITEIDDIANRASGLLGLSGMSADIRELLKSDDPAAAFAIKYYCYRISKYIGAYAAVLGGIDAILFGGGVGENSFEVRERALERIAWCGARIDTAANTATIGREGRISSADSDIDVWVIPVDEAGVMAESAARLIREKAKG